MTEQRRYPRRLIEVDLPARELSSLARKEKSIRKGHISTLHLWWSRKPLASSRAVLCASLWPDPVDPACPEAFRTEAIVALRSFAAGVARDRTLLTACAAHWSRWKAIRDDWQPTAIELRGALLDFLVDYAGWDAGDHPQVLEVAQRLTAASGSAGSPPLVVDPFAGGASFPLEGLRSGAHVFASDVNPVAAIMNIVLVSHLPKYGATLAAAARKWGHWVHQRARAELSRFYNGNAVAYIWARQIRCEGPACGSQIPLLNTTWISKRRGQPCALVLQPSPSGEIELALAQKPGAVLATISKANALCPSCGFTTPAMRVRAQLMAEAGGTDTARLCCVVTLDGRTRAFRAPTDEDLALVSAARRELLRRDDLSMYIPSEAVPHEKVWRNNPIRVHLYGIARWGDLFSARQKLALATYARLIGEAGEQIASDAGDHAFADAVRTFLALSLSRFADICNAMCRWESTKTQVRNLFVRQAISMNWGFAEPAIFTEGVAGNYETTLGSMLEVLDRLKNLPRSGDVAVCSANTHPLPDDSAALIMTDPPYADAVPYATISDFFYVWLKRCVPESLADWFQSELIKKADECVVDDAKGKDGTFFRRVMTASLAESRRVLRPDGVAVVVFAHKSTSAWEELLESLLVAGWTVTASWPVDTELANRMRARDSAALGSTIHIVCRPRENPDGSLRTDDIGDWRSVLRELPERIHEWMPRLAKEGIVGADAIFACIGPALEIFSRYSEVEKASGEKVALREYLEHVWAAVAREALSTIFDDADATGLEADARLTAMWLWTLAAGTNGTDAPQAAEDDDDTGDDDEAPAKAKLAGGFSMEFDAARKIAQGLGAHLENMKTVVEVAGDNARLLGVAERTRFLFGKDASAPTGRARAAKPKQLSLFAELEAVEQEAGWGDTGSPTAGVTTLDRVHQSLVLFAAGRGDALKRFLVDEGVGRDPRFWTLAQSLSALYPGGTDEKRWVDGVLARKKGLGFG